MIDVAVSQEYIDRFSLGAAPLTLTLTPNPNPMHRPFVTCTVCSALPD
jgi:hypothetical protein